LSALTIADHPSDGDALAALCELDCLFLALPHGESMRIVPKLPDSIKVVDLGADYRLSSSDRFKQYYDLDHEDGAGLGGFVYGLTEINRRRIVEASRVANPGCFATVIGLSLYPLVSEGLIAGKIVVDAKTGSTGSGIKPSPSNHHPI